MVPVGPAVQVRSGEPMPLSAQVIPAGYEPPSLNWVLVRVMSSGRAAAPPVSLGVAPPVPPEPVAPPDAGAAPPEPSLLPPPDEQPGWVVATSPTANRVETRRVDTRVATSVGG